MFGHQTSKAMCGMSLPKIKNMRNSVPAFPDVSTKVEANWLAMQLITWTALTALFSKRQKPMQLTAGTLFRVLRFRRSLASESDTSQHLKGWCLKFGS